MKFSAGLLPALTAFILLILPHVGQAKNPSGQWFIPKQHNDFSEYAGPIHALITARDRKNALKLDFDPYNHEHLTLTKEQALKRLNKFASTAIFDRLQAEWELLSYRWSAKSKRNTNTENEISENFQPSEGLEWTPDISYRVRSRYLEMVTHFNYSKILVQAFYQGKGMIQFEQRIPQSLTQFGASFNQDKEHLEFSLSRPLAKGLIGKMSQQHGNQQSQWFQVAELMFNHTF